MRVSKLILYLYGNFHPHTFALNLIVLLLQDIHVSFGYDLQHWNNHDASLGLPVENTETKTKSFDAIDRHTRSLNPWYLLYEREYARHAGSHHRINESNVQFNQIPKKRVDVTSIDRNIRSLNPWYLLYEREYARHAGTHRKSNKNEAQIHQLPLHRQSYQDKRDLKLTQVPLNIKRDGRSLNPWYLLYELEYAKHSGTHHKLNENVSPGDRVNKNIYKRQTYFANLNSNTQKLTKSKSVRKDSHDCRRRRSAINQQVSIKDSKSSQEDEEKTKDESIDELMHLYTKIGHILNPLMEKSNKGVFDLTNGTNGSLSSGTANISNVATNNTRTAPADSFQSALPEKSDPSGNTTHLNGKRPAFTHFVTELPTMERKDKPNVNDESRFRQTKKQRTKTKERQTHRRRKLHYHYEHFLSENSAIIPSKNLTKSNHLKLKINETQFENPAKSTENKSIPLTKDTNYRQVNLSELENLLYTTLRKLNATKHLPKTQKPTQENVTLTDTVTALGESNVDERAENSSMSDSSSSNEGQVDEKPRATNVSDIGNTFSNNQTEISVDHNAISSAITTSNTSSPFKIFISADVKSNETLYISPTNNSLLFKVMPRNNVIDNHNSSSLDLDASNHQSKNATSILGKSNAAINNTGNVESSNNGTVDAKRDNADALTLLEDKYLSLDDVKGVNISKLENESFEDAMDDDLKSKNQSFQINSSTDIQMRQDIHLTNSTNVTQLNETNQKFSISNEIFDIKNQSRNSTSDQQTKLLTSIPSSNTTLNISLHFQPIDNETTTETNGTSKEEITENPHNETENATASSIHNSSEAMPVSHGVEVLQVESNNVTALQEEPFFIHAVLKNALDKSKKPRKESSNTTQDKREENCLTKTPIKPGTCLVYQYPTKDRSESNVVIDYINDPGLEDDDDGGYARKHVESPNFKSDSKQNGQPDDQVVISSHNPDPTGKPKLVKLYVDPSAERVFGKHNLLHPYFNAYNNPFQSPHTSSHSYYDHSTGEADAGGQHYNDSGNNLMCYQPPCDWSNGPQRDVPGYEG